MNFKWLALVALAALLLARECVCVCSCVSVCVKCLLM